MAEIKKKLSGRGARRKGLQFERDIAIKLREFWPEAKRGIQTQENRKVPDVDYTPYWIECKKGVATSPKSAYKQALRDKGIAEDDREILVITKDDRDETLATMRLDYFLHILRVWEITYGR